MTAKSALTAVAILLPLALLASQLLNLDIVHHDDAEWYLAAYEDRWDIVNSFAVSQGRIWAYVAGSILYISLYVFDTALGDFLRVGSFVIFFIALHYLLSLYAGLQTAVMAALFNISLISIRWEGSILTSYPGIFWILGTIFLISVVTGRTYSKNGSPRLLIGSLALFFLSLFIHEGVSILFMSVFALSCVANEIQLGAGDFGIVNPRILFRNPKSNSAKLLIGCISVSILYLATYFIWRLIFPSTYVGNTIGSLNIVAAIPVLATYSLSGSVLWDFFAPYQVGYLDAINPGRYVIEYDPYTYLTSASVSILHAFIALVVGVAVCLQFSHSTAMTDLRRADREVNKDVVKNRAALTVAGGTLLGLSIIILPILPISLVPRYQELFYASGVRSYVYTALSHFGVGICIAFIVNYLGSLIQYRTRVIAGVVLGIVTALMAYSALGVNQAVITDMQDETKRWKVIDISIDFLKSQDMLPAALIVPRLSSGTWFTRLDEGYWNNYIRAAHDQDVSVILNPLAVDWDQGKNMLYVDYDLSAGSGKMVISYIHLDRSSIDSNLARRITVYTENTTPNFLAGRAVSYWGAGRNVGAIRFVNMNPLDEGGHFLQANFAALIPTISVAPDGNLPMIELAD